MSIMRRIMRSIPHRKKCRICGAEMWYTGKDTYVIPRIGHYDVMIDCPNCGTAVKVGEREEIFV